MPWLIKGQPKADQNLLFVHVPRCGGTSLQHHFDIPRKVLNGRSLWGKFGFIVFSWRYKQLEKANFPIWTWFNFVSALGFALSLYLRATAQPYWYPLARFMSIVCISVFICLSFVFTAPIIGRQTYVRRMHLVIGHYVMCRWMESIEWCTGTNKHGYMMHLTAQKLLAYGYVTADEMENVCSMAIVRNPYSRMVSIYSYNRYGSCESFSHFIKDWYKMMRHYRERGEMEEWYTPCHGIPQYEFTHYAGKQVVQSIVKQEELKFLKTKEDSINAPDSSVKDLPDPVRNALLDMPHTNVRKRTKPWWEYYDQETLNLTYELYEQDFNIFGYSPMLDKRPDLKSPVPMPVDESIVDSMKRDSVKGLTEDQRSFRHSLLVESSIYSLEEQNKGYEMNGVGSSRSRSIVDNYDDVVDGGGDGGGIHQSFPSLRSGGGGLGQNHSNGKSNHHNYRSGTGLGSHLADAFVGRRPFIQRPSLISGNISQVRPRTYTMPIVSSTSGGVAVAASSKSGNGITNERSPLLPLSRSTSL